MVHTAENAVIAKVFAGGDHSFVLLDPDVFIQDGKGVERSDSSYVEVAMMDEKEELKQVDVDISPELEDIEFSDHENEGVMIDKEEGKREDVIKIPDLDNLEFSDHDDEILIDTPEV